MLLGLFSFACSPYREQLSVLSGARRLAEMANGELLIGTSGGDLWYLSSFGGMRAGPHLQGGAVLDLATDPAGRYWARVADGTVYEGGLWKAPRTVSDSSVAILRGCESTAFLGHGDLPPGTTAISLAGGCDERVWGTRDGQVQETQVSASPISRVQWTSRGVLWVDAAGLTGCVRCVAPLGAYA